MATILLIISYILSSARMHQNSKFDDESAFIIKENNEGAESDTLCPNAELAQSSMRCNQAQQFCVPTKPRQQESNSTDSVESKNEETVELLSSQQCSTAAMYDHFK